LGDPYSEAVIDLAGIRQKDVIFGYLKRYTYILMNNATPKSFLGVHVIGRTSPEMDVPAI